MRLSSEALLILQPLYREQATVLHCAHFPTPPTLVAPRRALDPCDHRFSAFFLEGGLDDLPLRVFFPPAHPLARRDVPLARAKVFRFSHLCPKWNSQTVLHCAHGTSTVSSCAFCEQEGWSGC